MLKNFFMIARNFHWFIFRAISLLLYIQINTTKNYLFHILGGSVETGITVNSMVSAPNSMPSLPLNYIEYDPSYNLYPSSFLLSADRYPPKYEDALKLPSATPRRSSCTAIPPPFYDNSSMDGQNGKFLMFAENSHVSP
jgi:hypothetical protein